MRFSVRAKKFVDYVYVLCLFVPDVDFFSSPIFTFSGPLLANGIFDF